MSDIDRIRRFAEMYEKNGNQVLDLIRNDAHKNRVFHDTANVLANGKTLFLLYESEVESLRANLAEAEATIDATHAALTRPVPDGNNRGAALDTIARYFPRAIRSQEPPTGGEDHEPTDRARDSR